jgi:hypothetical protein
VHSAGTLECILMRASAAASSSAYKHEHGGAKHDALSGVQVHKMSTW